MAHQTDLSRSNGVIHEEPEVRRIDFPPGVLLRINATYTDECTARRVVRTSASSAWSPDESTRLAPGPPAC